MYTINILIFYTAILLLTYLLFKIAKLFLDKYFQYKVKRATSITYPIIQGFTIIITAFIAKNGLGEVLITGIINLINNNTGLVIDDRVSSTSGDVIGEIFFYFSITTITIIYIIYAFKRQRKELSGLESIATVQKVEFPENTYNYLPNFEDRVKQLFELKFEKQKIKLDWDPEYNILYASYIQGLHSYSLIIYCQKGKDSKRIKLSRMNQVNGKLESLINKHDELNNSDVIDKYFLIEKGKFDQHKLPIICYSEDDLLNDLIDFSDYLNSIIHDFENNKLPFTTRNKEENQLTLSETFIEPSFMLDACKDYVGKDLKSLLNKWLEKEENRHLVILGDYGMGKSSFSEFYAMSLAKEILNGEKVKRIPIFISLTNTSPRHGGIQIAIGKFLADNIGVSTRVFKELVDRGKVVFILDGFDEMGFVDTHAQRVKQLNAIWQLATNNNKILISGRPSYFPSDKELAEVFNLKEGVGIKVPSENPFFQRVYLHEFGLDEIEESIKRYDYGEEEVKEYLEFICNNDSILELCKRPSMMHIVREMLPVLFKKYNKEELNGGMLMENYLEHWMDRQLNKDIVSAIEDKKMKKEFILDFFMRLAEEYYLLGVDSAPSELILDLLHDQSSKLELNSPSEKEGFEAEILTAYFIEIDNDEYKFVHKSFKEYLIARKIIELIRTKKVKYSQIASKQWTNEIISFVYDSELIDKSVTNSKRIPLLFHLLDESKFRISYRCNLFRFRAFIDYFVGLPFSVLEDSLSLLLSRFKPRISEDKKKAIEKLDILGVDIDSIVKDLDKKDSGLLNKLLTSLINKIIARRSENMGLTAKFFLISLLAGQLDMEREKILIRYLQNTYHIELDIK